MLDRLFHLKAQHTDVRTEIIAGVTTFLATAYIIFVQPAVLSAAGMDFGAVMVATCLASGIATILMALLANYPIDVAPAMGHNFYFAFGVVIALHVPWQTALGAVAIAGAIFILTAGIGLRERLITALPPFLQAAEMATKQAPTKAFVRCLTMLPDYTFGAEAACRSRNERWVTW